MKAEELAAAHWIYIKDLLLTHEEKKSIIDLIEFHYVTAFIHGYKHRGESKKNAIEY